MNKNIKRIVAMVLAIGTVSAVAPAINLNLLTTKAYASDTNDESTLDSLELNDSDGKTIKFYEDNDYEDRIDEDDVDEDTIYYAKTSSKTVSIDISGPSNRYVRVFSGTSDSKKGKEINDDITLSDDSVVTTLIIKVYGEDLGDDTIRNNDDDDNQYDLLNTYKIKVKYIAGDATAGDATDTTNSSENGDYDNIYLERLSVEGKMIDLSDSKTKYVYNVDSNIDEVTIRATPEDEGDDDVTIDGEDADYDEKYKVKVALDKGENVIEIEVEDDGKLRLYTLVINRGNVSTTSTTSSSNNTSTETEATTKINKWIQANGKWQYNDLTGKPAKNTWVENYYLQSNGDMATGWLNYGDKWYYLGTDGARKTGWQKVDGNWYCLDSQGKTQTGWFKDLDGKYYYLNSFGAMVYNTTINGYKLGANGAWTGK